MYSPKTGWGPALEVLAANDLRPIVLEAKEGLALINGTQLITSIGAEALVRGRNVVRQADVVMAMTLEALQGTSTAFLKNIHEVRPISLFSLSVCPQLTFLHP